MENQPLFERLKAGPFFILGPCVIESRELLMEVGEVLAELKSRHGLEIIFKSSFDKANRTSVKSFRGPGLEKGLALLAEVKRQFGLPILTDIHEAAQAAPAAEVADILQIPAFLCRQTDLLLAAGETGRIVNIKKGQFLSGADMQFPAEKVASTGNQQILLTERGNMYGYNNLVVDFRNIPDMQAFGYPVVMDCTHSVQRPGGAGGKTGGNREFVPAMARAAGAFGADGYFLEVHPHPPKALSDGPNMLYLKNLEPLLLDLMASGS
jgi:2-dehydro-3-deoxyphosphooctonate aldolase (KDO 8-P synthase)